MTNTTKRIPRSECIQGTCASLPTGCWGECSIRAAFPLNNVACGDPVASALTLDNAPVGTLAPADGGGRWYRMAQGWKWNGPDGSGGAFPRPGGDWTGKLVPPASPVAAPEAPTGTGMEVRYENLLRIQRAEAEDGDPYMLGLYNGMLMMCANEDGKIFDPFVPAATTASAELSDDEAYAQSGYRNFMDLPTFKALRADCRTKEATTASDPSPKYENFTDRLGRVTGVRFVNADQMPSYASPAATTASASLDTLLEAHAAAVIAAHEHGENGGFYTDLRDAEQAIRDAIRAPAPSREAAPQAAAVREAIEHAARICESHCACDNGEDDEAVNWVLRNRAAQIRGLVAAHPGDAPAGGKGAAS